MPHTTVLDEKAIAKLDPEAMQPKILFVDLETSPILQWGWTASGKDYRALDVEQDSRILCFAYRWQHEKRTRVISLSQSGKRLNRFKIDDWFVVEKLWHLFNEADLIVAQNGNNFDIKVANTRFLGHGLPPPKEHKDVDTLVIARKYFKMSFNSLDDICRFLKLPRKGDPGSKKTWFDFMDGDSAAQRRMELYNIRDVDCLINVYDRMKGWYKNHPNLNFYTRNNGTCPTCLSGHIKKDGIRAALRTGVRQRYVCMDCTAFWYTQIIKSDQIVTSYK